MNGGAARAGVWARAAFALMASVCAMSALAAPPAPLLAGAPAQVLPPVGESSEASALPPRPLTGELSGGFSYSREAYVSEEVWLEGTFSKQWLHRELSGKAEVRRGYVRSTDSPATLDTDRHDAFLKLRFFDEFDRYYTYLSPRTRHNAFGYYRDSLAMRAGAGRATNFASGAVLLVEAGLGYRVAHTMDDTRIRESLNTLALKWHTELRPGVRLELDAVSERGSGERYRTVDLSLRNHLTHRFGLKTTLGYGRAFPFDAQAGGSELNVDISLYYDL
jgi:putative salt-induced outer membrane protein YdiY